MKRKMAVLVLGTLLMTGVVGCTNHTEIDNTATTSPVEGTKKLDEESLAHYAGEWQQPGQKGDYLKNGGTHVSLSYLGGGQFKFKMSTISSAPTNMIAQVDTTLLMTKYGTSTFDFDNDGWFNKGSGIVRFLDDKVEVIVNVSEPDPQANWHIKTGVVDLIRQK